MPYSNNYVASNELDRIHFVKHPSLRKLQTFGSFEVMIETIRPSAILRTSETVMESSAIVSCLSILNRFHYSAENIISDSVEMTVATILQTQNRKSAMSDMAVTIYTTPNLMLIVLYCILYKFTVVASV